MKYSIKYGFVNVVTATCLTLSLTSASFANQPSFPQELYTPSIIEEMVAENVLTGELTEVNGLPITRPYNADMVNTENVVSNGENVYVAILDTGMVPEWPFFFSEAKVAVDLAKGFSHDVYWDDQLQDVVIGPLRDDRGFITEYASGHGTHVASTVVGFNINNREWVQGIAPNVTIIPVLVLDAWAFDSPFGTLTFSGGTNAMIAAGIRYVADLDLDGRVVINMSLGGPSRSAEIEAAINYALSKDVVIVASAGNSGTDGMGYPGGLPQLISVGAAGWSQMLVSPDSWRSDVPEKTNSNDMLGNNGQYFLADFSSRPVKQLGQKHKDLDVSAPGNHVVGPYKSAFADNLNYYFLSGTSMSAPHVSAIAAMLLQQDPTLTPSAVEKKLRNAAHGNPLPADDAVFVGLDGALTPATWDGGDYGSGFLRADYVVN
jgi:subtilisin family serine protease